MEKQHEKHQEKYGWVENKSQEAAVMLLEATKRDENGIPSTLPPPFSLIWLSTPSFFGFHLTFF
jgi:hypothetical protein